MKKSARVWIAFSVVMILTVVLATSVFAGERTHKAKYILIGGDTLYNSEASFRLNHLEFKWDKGIVKKISYYITSGKDARLTLIDAQYLGVLDEEEGQKILWKQSDEETLGFIIDNLDESENTRKHYSKSKFFTSEVPFAFKTGILRWVVEIKGKTYNVDWNLKANEISYQEVL